MLIEINGRKLKKLRGTRSLMEISELSKGKFTDVALMLWEKGDRKPKRASIKALLKVYECKLEDIAEPVKL